MAEGISVIVCCYNSETRIAETLSFLSSQKVPGHLLWEVIVVNNASKDNTKSVAAQSWKSSSSNVSFQIVDQPEPGLSMARQKGIDVSRYDILIFCDDDNHFDPDYVANADRLMRSKPDVGIMGGWVKPKLPVYPGSWIEDFYPALAIGKQADDDGYVEWVFGAGMIMRKNVFDTLKENKIDLLLSDRVGTKQTSGGDAEICMAARFVSFKIYYSNSLILDHQISAHRLTKKSFVKGNYRNVFPVVYLYLMEKLMKDRESRTSRMYGSFFRERISQIFYFLPRLILGKHKFYSQIMFYQNIQLFYWLLTRKARFEYTANDIKKNLYHAGE